MRTKREQKVNGVATEPISARGTEKIHARPQLRPRVWSGCCEADWSWSCQRSEGLRSPRSMADASGGFPLIDLGHRPADRHRSSENGQHGCAITVPYQVRRARYCLSGRFFCFWRNPAKHIVDRFDSGMWEASKLSSDSKERLDFLSRHWSRRLKTPEIVAATRLVAVRFEPFFGHSCRRNVFSRHRIGVHGRNARRFLAADHRGADCQNDSNHQKAGGDQAHGCNASDLWLEPEEQR